MPDLNKLINEKIKLLDLADFEKSIKTIQRSVFKESIDFYIAEKNKLADKSFSEIGNLGATSVNRFEKRLTDAIEKNATYKSNIRNYLADFDKVATLNKKIHKVQNKINIDKIINIANKNQRELISKTAKGVTSSISDKTLYKNLAGDGMREQFTKPVKRMLYQNLMTGAPETQVKTILHDYIIGKKDEIGQLQRWTGQITRDALSQYDGAINDMVRKEYDLNAFKYIGSIALNSRLQCKKWITEKNRILKYSELTKEIQWAVNNGKGMIPGTTKDNFASNRGGFNCRHQALAIRTEEEKKRKEKIIKKEIIRPEKPKVAKPIKIQEKPLNFKRKANIDKKTLENIRTNAEKIEKQIGSKNINKITEYTGQNYEKINTSLRTGSKADWIKNYSKSMNETLDKLPNYKGDTFRSFAMSRDAFEKSLKNQLQTGNVFSDKAFFSTTQEMKRLGSFGRLGNTKVLMRIESKTGKYIAPFSKFASEEEVLFKSNTKFFVKSIKKTKIREWETYKVELSEVL